MFNLSTSLRIFPIELINQAQYVLNDNNPPCIGDVIKVRVKKHEINQLNRLELYDNSIVDLGTNDVFLGVLGNRCTVDYLSGGVPDDIWSENLHTLSIGGIVGKIDNITINAPHPPILEMIGYATINGKRLNTLSFFKENGHSKNNVSSAKVIVVIGDGRSSGKTSTVCKLTTVLKEFTGKSISAMKLTGIARKRDILKIKSSGSNIVFDFIDCGLPSSVIDERIYYNSIEYLLYEQIIPSDLWICELGGGLLSEYNVETAINLLEKKLHVIAYVICAKTRTATYGCYSILKSLNHQVKPVFFSGAITNSIAGILSIRKYSNDNILNIYDENLLFFNRINEVLSDHIW